MDERWKRTRARCAWDQRLRNARAIFFQDNFSVADALIKGNAREIEWRQLLLAREICDQANACCSGSLVCRQHPTHQAEEA